MAAADNRCVCFFFLVFEPSASIFGHLRSLGAAGHFEQRKPRAWFDHWPDLHHTLLQSRGNQPQTHVHVFMAFLVNFKGCKLKYALFFLCVCVCACVCRTYQSQWCLWRSSQLVMWFPVTTQSWASNVPYEGFYETTQITVCCGSSKCVVQCRTCHKLSF